ncbi:uncharacterized protein LOC142344757 isoform X3 [Convolutriloba macropyga]|uniref:uncharacterized protein LOC142344757 isoform X2 n=1 Tax=Convolutriloba macropyga TaxID=536237 RepID=UPI003F526A6C
MFTIKNFQDKLRRRDEDQLAPVSSQKASQDGEVVASGLLCPNCRKAFADIEELMVHVSVCAQESLQSDDSNTYAVQERRGSSQSTSESSSSVYSTTMPVANGTSTPKTITTDSGVPTPVSKNMSGSPFSATPSFEGSSKKPSIYETAQMQQEVVRWKAECDEQRSVIESLRHQLKAKEELLERKMKYVEKLERDILQYEEKSDDHAAVRNELGSLQQLVTNMSAEHEKEVNELLDKLHCSEEERNNITNACRAKNEMIASLEAKLASFENSTTGAGVHLSESLINEHGSYQPQPSDPSMMQNYADMNPPTVMNQQHQQSSEMILSQPPPPQIQQQQPQQYAPEIHCQKCIHNEQVIAQLSSQVNSMRSFSDSTVVALQQQVEQLQAKAAKGCDMCREYETQLNKEHRQHVNEITALQNQLAAVDAKSSENNALYGRTEAMNISLSNELKIKREEIDDLNRSLHDMKLNLESADKERGKLRGDVISMNFLPEKNEQLTSEIRILKAEIVHCKQKIAQLEKNQLAAVDAKSSENNALYGRTEAMNISLSNELKIKREEIDDLNRSLHDMKLNLESADKEREKLRGDVISMNFLPEKNEQLTSEIRILKAEIVHCKQKIAQLEKERDVLRRQVEESASQVEMSERNLFEAEHQKSILQSQWEEQRLQLNKEIDTLRSNISAVRDEMSESESRSEEQMSMLNQNLGMLRNELNLKEEEANKAEWRVSELEQQLMERAAEVKGFKQSAESLKDELDAKNQEFNKLKSHYVEIRSNLEGAQRVMFELGREQQSLQVEKSRWLERNWLPDDHVDNCLSCDKEFSATVRKHHCRCCGKIFCNDCSSRRASLPAHPTPVRVCNDCSQLLTNSHLPPVSLSASTTSTPSHSATPPAYPVE